MTTQDEQSLKNEIQHIFDSGANEIRILEMVKSFIKKREQALYIHDVSTSGGYNSGNGRCEKCGKPFVYVGDVPDGGFMEGLEPYCTCNVKKQTAGMYGWICPKCGAGLSPFTTICPCSMPKWEVTC